MKLCARVALVFLSVVFAIQSLEAGEMPMSKPIKGRYIVTFKAGQISSVPSAASDLAVMVHGKVHRIWDSTLSFELEVDDAAAESIRNLPYIDFIEQDREVTFQDSLRT